MARIKRGVGSMGGAFRIIGGANAGLYYRHGDHLGSTSVISDANGLKIPGSDVQYAPFGELRSGELSALTDFGYTGQRLDRSTGGLMYYGARYYLPGLRRFISADTVMSKIPNPQAFNRYTYVLNNPIKYLDPSGHEPEKWTNEWWVWRYYELELWKYKDPGHDIHTKAQFADHLKTQLQDYGVDVVIDDSVNDKDGALRTIFDAVDAIGRKINQSLGNVVTNARAFRLIMGASHRVTVLAAASSQSTRN